MEGQRRRVYWATSPLTGWKIVLNISEDTILVPVRQLMLRSALIGVAGLAALILIVSLIARRLANPLLNLTRTATAIEQGDFREEMLGDLPQRRDELGELARSFRKMAARNPGARAKPGGVESKPGTHRRRAHGGIDRARG